MTEATATNAAADSAADTTANQTAADTGAAAQTTQATQKHWSGIEGDGAQETIAYLEKKGWKDPSAVPGIIKSYQNLEGLLGRDKVALPKDEKDAAGWDRMFSAMGRPDKPEAYELPVPEGQKDDFAKTAATWMHQAGLGKAQAQKLAGAWNEYMGAQQKAADDAFATESEQQANALKAAWGKDFQANAELASRARKGLGITDDQLEALERAWGTKATVEFFHKVGSENKEASFINSNFAPGKFGVASRAQAEARIEELKGDRDFSARLASGDTKAKSEWEYLHKLISGEGFVTGGPAQAKA